MNIKLLSILLIINSSLFATNINQLRVDAEKGHAKAQFNLGVCYDNGDGVAVNKAEAVKWYRKAAEQGNAGAQEALRLLSPKPRPNFCSQCGTKVQTNAKFCSQCGTRL